jgi:hypothetical protein
MKGNYRGSRTGLAAILLVGAGFFELPIAKGYERGYGRSFGRPRLIIRLGALHRQVNGGDEFPVL